MPFPTHKYIINLIAPHLLSPDGGPSLGGGGGCGGLFSNEHFGSAAEDDDDNDFNFGDYTDDGVRLAVPGMAGGIGGAAAGAASAGVGVGAGMTMREEFPLVTLDPSVFKARKSSRKSEDANV